MLNYNDNCICVNIAPGKSLKFDEALYGEPTTTPLTLDEIRYINNGIAFKAGWLEFPEELEDEIYEELRIDKSKILKLKDIKDILLHPTKDGLIKILSIQSLADFDRVRGQFQKLKYDGYKLTLDIANIIERRTKELFNNQLKSDIVIEDADVVPNDNGKVAELEKQLKEMRALLEATLSNNTKTDDNKLEKDSENNESENSNKQSSSTVKKKVGRPKSTTSK